MNSETNRRQRSAPLPGSSRTHRRLAFPLIIAMLFSFGGLLLPAAAVTHAAPAVGLSTKTAAPGDTVKVTGFGFAGNDTVEVAATVNVHVPTAPQGHQTQQREIRTTAKTDANGSFAATVTLPDMTLPATYQVRARDSHGHVAAKGLTVLALVFVKVGEKSPPNVDIVSDHDFFIAGSGFLPGEVVAIAATFQLYNGNQVTVTKKATADKNGSFDHVLAHVPRDSQQGKATLTASGQSNTSATGNNGSTGSTVKNSATATITVVYRPWFTLNPSTLRPNGAFSLHGQGFVPNTTVTVSVAIPRSGDSTVTLSKDVQSDDKGALSTSFSLPLHTKTGAYTVSAIDKLHNLKAASPLHITLAPVLATNPHGVVPGQKVTLTGAGFSAQADVTIHSTVQLFNGTTSVINLTARTDGQGNFKTQVGLPGKAAPGTVHLTATGPNGSASTAVAVSPVNLRISLAPQNVRPGTGTTVRGAGFPAGDDVAVSVTVKLSSGETRTISVHATANASGAFSTSLQLPGDTAVGAYQVRADSSQSGRTPAARLQVSVNAGIHASPSSVTPGGSVQVNGAGFSSSIDVTISAVVPLYGGGSRTVSTRAKTGPNGGFAGKLSIPSDAASGPVTISAQGPNAKRYARVNVQNLNILLSLNPVSAIPGSSVTISGIGLPAGDSVTVSTTVNMAGGGTRLLSATARTNNNGSFSATLNIPGNAIGGNYMVHAVSKATGRTPAVRLAVVTLKPSAVVAPVSAAPGTAVSVNGFGFAAGERVAVTLEGKTMTTVTADNSGKFATKITIPSDLPSGAASIALKGNAGHNAGSTLTVQRSVSTTFYFASLYTGIHNTERIAILNPSATRARVTITYQLSNGTSHPVTVAVPGHTRYTRDVNADLGAKVAAGAVVQADVPIAAERISYQRGDGDAAPGVRHTSPVWYFADGNTSGHYRVYIAVQNPNSAPVSVSFRILPTHHKPIVVTKTMSPTSRLTLKVNNYVRDAVGVVVTSSAPVVANRTIKIGDGVNSKIGVTAPQRTWYFAGGTAQPGAREYIGVINPSAGATPVTLHLYRPDGQEVRTVHTTLQPGARLGYNINKLAHRTDVAAALTAAGGVVAEQTSYVGNRHHASTDTFGVISPAKTWAFAAVNTTGARNESSVVDLFNPGLAPAPIVVQFMTSSGAVTQRTYIVGPLQHQRIDVASVQPNAELGILASSSSPFVAMNRMFFNGHSGSMTSQGVKL